MDIRGIQSMNDYVFIAKRFPSSLEKDISAIEKEYLNSSVQ